MILEMVMHLGAGFGEVWGCFGGGLGRLWRWFGEAWKRFGVGLGMVRGALGEVCEEVWERFGEAWVAPPDSGFIIWNLKKLGLGNY